MQVVSQQEVIRQIFDDYSMNISAVLVHLFNLMPHSIQYLQFVILIRTRYEIYQYNYKTKDNFAVAAQYVDLTPQNTLVVIYRRMPVGNYGVTRVPR